MDESQGARLYKVAKRVLNRATFDEDDNVWRCGIDGCEIETDDGRTGYCCRGHVSSLLFFTKYTAADESSETYCESRSVDEEPTPQDNEFILSDTERTNDSFDNDTSNSEENVGSDDSEDDSKECDEEISMKSDLELTVDGVKGSWMSEDQIRSELRLELTKVWRYVDTVEEHMTQLENSLLAVDESNQGHGEDNLSSATDGVFHQLKKIRDQLRALSRHLNQPYVGRLKLLRSQVAIDKAILTLGTRIEEMDEAMRMASVIEAFKDAQLGGEHADIEMPDASEGAEHWVNQAADATDESEDEWTPSIYDLFHDPEADALPPLVGALSFKSKSS